MANLWAPFALTGANDGSSYLVTATEISTAPLIWGFASHTFRIPTTVTIQCQVRMRQEGTLSAASVISESLILAIVVDGAMSARGLWRPPNAAHMQATMSFQEIVNLDAGVHTFQVYAFINSPLAGTVYTLVGITAQKSLSWTMYGTPQDGQVY